MTIEAELNVPAATVRLVHFEMPDPVDEIVRYRDEDAYRIDLCLTPRPKLARACYRELWPADRFERIGDVFVIPPREVMQVRSDSGRQTSIVCELHPEPIHTWLDGDLKWEPRQLEASLDIPNPGIRYLLLRLAEEVRQPGFASRILVELTAVQLAIELRRYCLAIDEDHPTRGLAPWRLRLIDQRLEEVREPPTLAELASLCKLSVRQLTRGFRTSRGCSIGDYVALTRVDHAKRLLAKEHAIKTIAHTLGFSSSSSFATAFRRATGMAPRAYRQRLLCKE